MNGVSFTGGSVAVVLMADGRGGRTSAMYKVFFFSCDVIQQVMW